MTFQPEADKPTEIRCPLNFTVQPARPIPNSCGFASCHPASCELLRRQGSVIPCHNWEQGK